MAASKLQIRSHCSPATATAPATAPATATANNMRETAYTTTSSYAKDDILSRARAYLDKDPTDYARAFGALEIWVERLSPVTFVARRCCECGMDLPPTLWRGKDALANEVMTRTDGLCDGCALARWSEVDEAEALSALGEK
jgi:hypothetical protein